MTYKETLRFLNRVEITRTKARLMRDRVEYARHLASGLGKRSEASDRVQSSGSGDRLSSAVADVIKAEKEAEPYIRAADEAERAVIDAIYKLRKTEYIDVLYRRFVLLQSYQEIADGMGYTVHYVFELRRRAIATLGRVMG